MSRHFTKVVKNKFALLKHKAASLLSRKTTLNVMLNSSVTEDEKGLALSRIVLEYA